MVVLRFPGKKSFPFDWQPYNVYAINQDRDDFRPELVKWQVNRPCTDTDESSDSLRPIHWNIIYPQVLRCAFFFFFCPATLEFISFSVFPILSDQLLEEINYRCQELFLRQEHIVRHKSVEDSWVNFNRSLRVVNFPCSDWLSYERTQLKIRVEFISTGFSNNCFCLKETHSL